MFRCKKQVNIPVEEARFNNMMELIKDLPKADYNRLKAAMDLGWEAYQKVRNVKTVDEKELSADEIEQAEATLDKLEAIK